MCLNHMLNVHAYHALISIARLLVIPMERQYTEGKREDESLKQQRKKAWRTDRLWSLASVFAITIIRIVTMSELAASGVRSSLYILPLVECES